MIRIFNAKALNILLLATIPSTRAMSVQSASQQATKNSMKGQSDIAIKAARDFTVSQRQKLKDLGALDIQRPLRITGEPLERGDDSTDQTDTITKVIHFQRHGQGFHNLICDIWREKGLPIDFDSKDPAVNPVIRNEFLDPPLTETGRQQCKDRQEECAQLSPELVIVSPLLRCIQTAKLSFQDHCYPNSDIPWVSHEGCREELGLLVGNKRRSISEIKFDYPNIDFSPIEHDEDVLWENYGDRRETLLEKSERIYDFLADYVRNRPEEEIAIVCHSAYLFTLLNAVMDIEEEDLRYWFLTSEVRSMRVRFEANDKHVPNE
jgi:broad specificity phosphatase PhoE